MKPDMHDRSIASILSSLMGLTSITMNGDFPTTTFLSRIFESDTLTTTQLSFYNAINRRFAEKYAKNALKNIPLKVGYALGTSMVLPKWVAGERLFDFCNPNWVEFSYDRCFEPLAPVFELTAARIDASTTLTIPQLNITSRSYQDPFPIVLYEGLSLSPAGMLVPQKRSSATASASKCRIREQLIQPYDSNASPPDELRGQMYMLIRFLSLLQQTKGMFVPASFGCLSDIVQSYLAFVGDIMKLAPAVDVPERAKYDSYAFSILQMAKFAHESRIPTVESLSREKTDTYFENALAWSLDIPFTSPQLDARRFVASRPCLVIGNGTSDRIILFSESVVGECFDSGVNRMGFTNMKGHESPREEFLLSLLSLALTLLQRRVESDGFCELQATLDAAISFMLRQSAFEQAFARFFAADIVAMQV